MSTASWQIVIEGRISLMSFIATSSTVKSSTFVPETSRVSSRSRFATVGIATAIAAGLANMLVYYLGSAVVSYDPDFVELGSAVGIGIFTLVLAIPAVLVYGLLLRRSGNPVRLFTIISAVVLVLSVIPDFTMIPSEPGATNAQTSILVLMHIVAAGVIVWMLTTFARPQND
jgi:Family of unknown function (DUF6069)